MRTILSICATLLIAAAPAPAIPAGTVKLATMPGSTLEATAKRIASADIEDGGGGALLLLGSQRLGTAGIGPALFVQVQSPRSCGSAGCSTSIYLPTKTGWIKILDAVSGPLVVQTGQHAGMHDILVGTDDRWAWNGRTYADTQPAPQIDLHPHAPRPATRTRSRAHP